jgi:hypothetical protein
MMGLGTGTGPRRGPNAIVAKCPPMTPARLVYWGYSRIGTVVLLPPFRSANPPPATLASV